MGRCDPALNFGRKPSQFGPSLASLSKITAFIPLLLQNLLHLKSQLIPILYSKLSLYNRYSVIMAPKNSKKPSKPEKTVANSPTSSDPEELPKEMPGPGKATLVKHMDLRRTP